MNDLSAYDYSFEKITGGSLPLDQFRGKALLVVNTASKCGYTPQYAGMQELYDAYAKRGLVVIGVPSNDFGGQEPGTNEEIHAFCHTHYAVDFPMTAKVPVNGPDAHPFYKWAVEQLGADATPAWNFHKILIDPQGNAVDWYPAGTAPVSEAIINRLEELLPAA